MTKLLRNLTIAAALLLGVSSVAHAAALTAARSTASKNTGAVKRYLMTASKTIYSGSLVMIANAGTVEPAAASASNQGIAGVAIETKTSAASGSYYILVQEGWFLFAGTTLSQGDVGLPVYAEDDQTVDETVASNEPCAGVMMEYVSASSAWVHVALTFTARWASSADPITFAGDVTLGGGAGAATFTDSASSVVLPDNDATALVIGSTGLLNFLTIDTGDNVETLLITGTTGVKAFDVGTGTSSFAEDVTLAGGAGAATFSDSASSVVVPDNDATALDIGSTGTTAGIRYDSTDSAENLLFNSAGWRAPGTEITTTTSLDASDCGKSFSVTAGIDTLTITLPDADAALGCELTLSYTGADAGALVDISPLDSDADGIEGGCTLAASVVTFSGIADADIGLTKATGLTGDYIKLWACGAAMWCVVGCQGIWANN